MAAGKASGLVDNKVVSFDDAGHRPAGDPGCPPPEGLRRGEPDADRRTAAGGANAIGCYHPRIWTIIILVIGADRRHHLARAKTPPLSKAFGQGVKRPARRWTRSRRTSAASPMPATRPGRHARLLTLAPPIDARRASVRRALDQLA
jgi:hypothetical protein